MSWLEEKKAYSLLNFYSHDSSDIFLKCQEFKQNNHAMIDAGLLTHSFRVQFDSGLDSKVKLNNGKTILCFDSNGYLGFHQHPKVKEAVIAA